MTRWLVVEDEDGKFHEVHYIPGRRRTYTTLRGKSPSSPGLGQYRTSDGYAVNPPDKEGALRVIGNGREVKAYAVAPANPPQSAMKGDGEWFDGFREGFLASARGESEQNNPYVHESPEHDGWLAGYRHDQ